eukprot:TRINITY_DN81277_c0_g1_i1.p1 TRINITY_DN81277_c0_g1~~TRINITY_DN81277_c0_g1_i1.p1  ORF type:complete len:821 (-),score=232.18 TRINITY_DN81277_c0_g1_i1:233-2695(-)
MTMTSAPADGPEPKRLKTSAEEVSATAEGGLPAQAVQKDVPPEPEKSAAIDDFLQRKRREAEELEAKVQAIKDQRLKDIVGEMDEQMRTWCRALSQKKCKGEPWKNISGTKVGVLSKPELDAEKFEGMLYIPPGSTFGVEEVRSGNGRNWLRLTNGGWVSDCSRKEGREGKVVVAKAACHQEYASEEVFKIGADEDRRDAYMRMVHRKSESELTVPEGLKVELMPYQVEGLEWLVSLFNNDLAGLLADEMGLGKTIQTVALIAFLRETKKKYGPHFIICPKSVLPNWQKEIARCYPEYEDCTIVFQGTPKEREELTKKIKKILKKQKKRLIVITNYEQVHPDRNKILLQPEWELVVVDEGHRMKNQKSVFHQTMKEHMKAKMKILLTGTPLQNNLDELFALLNYLLPEIFSDASSFKSWFAKPLMEKLESMDLNEYHVAFTPEEEQRMVSYLHAMLAPFLLQRTKADVFSFDKLPPRREEVIRVPLSAWQESVYADLRANVLRRVDGSSGAVSQQLLRNTTMQLRKIVLHPYLFGQGSKEQSVEDVMRAAGKVEALDRILRKLHKFKHKVLVFSQFTSVLDILERFLTLRSWKFERIDGQVSAEDRQERIRRFSDKDSEAFVFLLSARAGAVGLNLQAADTVILFDLDWNPQNDKQAIARAHRFGQTKEVLVLRLLTVSAIEGHMERMVNAKLDLEKKIIGAGNFSKGGGGKTPEERGEQLKQLLGLAGGEGDAKQASECTAFSETNRLMARTDEERVAFEAEDASLGLAISGEVQTPAVVGVDVVRDALVKAGRFLAPSEAPEAFELEVEAGSSEEEGA